MIVAAMAHLLGLIAAFLSWPVHAQSAAPFAAVDWAKSEPATLFMTEYAFTPRPLVLHVGVPTRLRLVNRGTEIHDFTAPDFLKSVDLRDPALIGSSGVGITVEPRQEKDVYLIARLPGRFGLICADHDWAGMTAEILVK